MNINKQVEKARQLDPEDPVRRGLLETLADFMLCRKSSRKIKKAARVEKRAKLLKY